MGYTSLRFVCVCVFTVLRRCWHTQHGTKGKPSLGKNTLTTTTITTELFHHDKLQLSAKRSRPLSLFCWLQSRFCSTPYLSGHLCAYRMPTSGMDVAMTSLYRVVKGWASANSLTNQNRTVEVTWQPRGLSDDIIAFYWVSNDANCRLEYSQVCANKHTHSLETFTHFRCRTNATLGLGAVDNTKCGFGIVYEHENKSSIANRFSTIAYYNGACNAWKCYDRQTDRQTDRP